MFKEFNTTSTAQTKKLGELLAQEFLGGSAKGQVICLSGELGAGKTTFTQGLLKGLKIKGPYTSPTFAIMKEYKLKAKSCKLQVVYHIDAYRITSKDLLALGFADFANQKDSLTIIEWPEKVKRLIPTNALWINFEWLSDKERKITFSTKKEH